ncbi:MAG TPA: YigZ family protein [Desulfotignum sp.]|nr:YigZ family protein [Desulfotignum sp.]
MAPKKQFYSIAGSADKATYTARLKIKRSLFICHLSHAGSIDAAKDFISKISRENKTATHNCWAYIVGDAGQVYHSSDAGEPSGTAGKPMLNVLASYSMTQVAAVVTRHYGGVKLGVRGLIQAYSDAVAAALDDAKKVRLVKGFQVRVQIPYECNDVFLNQISRMDAKIIDTGYGEQVIHEILIKTDCARDFEKLLSQYKNQGLVVL